MKTKLVYVLTCAPEATYIEQALMAVWSARYHNPDAQIVLIVDDKTDLFLTGKRGEILQYITEKKVVNCDGGWNMAYRSRWLKTQVRQLMDGSLLFVDCDTICQTNLSEIDFCKADVAAILDEHTERVNYVQSLDDANNSKAEIIGFAYRAETEYFNSGVMFWNDTEQAHALGKTWHAEWIAGAEKGVGIDQSSLGKANAMCGHLIQKMDGVWNTIVFMRPKWIEQAKIVHFWNYRNVSFMYTREFLGYVREHGLDAFVKENILHSIASMPPYPTIWSNKKVRDYLMLRRQIQSVLQNLKAHIPLSNTSLPWQLTSKERCLLDKSIYFASWVYVTHFYVHNKKRPCTTDTIWT